MPGLNLDDPRFGTASPEQIVAAYRAEWPQSVASGKSEPTPIPNDESNAHAAEEPVLETMIGNFGTLELDDEGHWDYHGNSSYYLFLQRLQNQFGSMVAPTRSPSRSKPTLRPPEDHPVRTWLPTDLDHDHGGGKATLPPTSDLPTEEAARRLCRSAFDQACVLMRFVHEPSFWIVFDRIYSSDWESFDDEERKFLPLLYAAMAVGCLFSDPEHLLNPGNNESGAGLGFVLSHHFVRIPNSLTYGFLLLVFDTSRHAAGCLT